MPHFNPQESQYQDPYERAESLIEEMPEVAGFADELVGVPKEEWLDLSYMKSEHKTDIPLLERFNRRWHPSRMSPNEISLEMLFLGSTMENLPPKLVEVRLRELLCRKIEDDELADWEGLSREARARGAWPDETRFELSPGPSLVCVVLYSKDAMCLESSVRGRP